MRRPQVSDTRSRNAKRPAGVTATLAMGWGLATMFLFAPAGGLFTIIGLDKGGATALAGCIVAVLSLNGFGLGIALITAAVRVLRSDREQMVHMSAIHTWSVIHHGAVAIAFLFIAIGAGGGEGLVAWALGVGVPCGLGWGQAAQLAGTAAALATRDDDDDVRSVDEGEAPALAAPVG